MQLVCNPGVPKERFVESSFLAFVRPRGSREWQREVAIAIVRRGCVRVECGWWVGGGWWVVPKVAEMIRCER